MTCELIAQAKPDFSADNSAPFLLQGATTTTATSEENLAQFFDSPIPEFGDVVELVCYARSPGNVMMKWRVRK